MSNLRLHDLVAIVTGSSSGIGRAIAVAFGNQGAKVVCADLEPITNPSPYATPTHEVISSSEEGEAIFVKVDISNSNSVKAMIDATVQHFGRLDIIVNNAGIGPEATNPQPIQTSSDEIFEKTLRVNTFGTFYCCRHASAQMLRQTPRKNGARGLIINISSGLAIIASPGVSCYAASKGAVSSLTRTVAVDLGKEGIRCSSIVPGYVETPLIARIDSGSAAASAPTGRHVKPEEVAQAAVFLASVESGAMTGSQVNVDGGQLAYLRM